MWRWRSGMAEPHNLKISIKVDNNTAVTGDSGQVTLENGSYIQAFRVNQTLGASDEASIQFQMKEMDDSNKVILLDSLKPGAALEIHVGYDPEATIFKGFASRISPHFSSGREHVTGEGFDASHFLTRGTNSRVFGDGHKVDQDLGTVAGTIVNDSKALKGGKSEGLSAQTDSVPSKVEYVAQYNESDYNFIQRLVGGFGMGWAANSHEDPKTISLKAIEPGASVLTIGRDQVDAASEARCISADFTINTIKAGIAEVRVRAWDIHQKKSIVGKASAPSKVVGGTAGHTQAGKAHYGSGSTGRIVNITNVPVTSKGEADAMAQALFDKYSMDWCTATVVIEGNPNLHAGVLVTLKESPTEFGIRYGGEYLVESCTHVFQAGSGQAYQTILGLCRNGSKEP
jgi:phage protein D